MRYILQRRLKTDEGWWEDYVASDLEHPITIVFKAKTTGEKRNNDYRWRIIRTDILEVIKEYD